jgi:transposase
MASITDQMTALYVFIDDYLKAYPAQAAWRRSPNNQPLFTDAEVLTIGLMQGSLGVASLKQTYRLIANNYRSAFPQLCSYPQWLARLHRLSALVGQLIQAALGVRGLADRLYVLDAKPIPVCKPIRHGRVQLLREDGAYFGKSTTGWFFGFKLHVLIHHRGAILCAFLTPGNINERDLAVPLGEAVDGGVALADCGYRSQPLEEAIAEEAELLLITPADLPKGSERRALISGLRERVETTFSQLWNRFADRVLSRSWNGLWNTLKLKMLHFNLCHVGYLPT